MSGRFVRQSSYRHVFGEAPKKEQQFTDVRPNPTGDGQCLTASAQFIAAPMQGGGGPALVLDASKPGRHDSCSKVAVHKGKILDLAFNPFMGNMLATASDDCMIKCTMVNAEGVAKKEVFSEACATLKGHQKKVQNVVWHPNASNVIASTSYDNTIKVWDVEKQTAINTVKTDGIHGCTWNSNGSMLGACLRTKQVATMDPRSNGEGMTVGAGPEGTKCARFMWCESIDKIIVLGFTRTSARQYMVYDIKNLDKPLAKANIDQSAGLMMTHYDPDNNMIYIAGKGDSTIKYFEVTSGKPYLHHLSEYSDSSSQKGVGWAPKYSLDTTKCEIARAYRVLRDTIQPVSFRVPRKSDMFQEDIFPDTCSWEPANNAGSYFGGEDKASNTITMDPEKREGGEIKEAKFEAKKSYEELEAELAAAHKEIAALKAKLG